MKKLSVVIASVVLTALHSAHAEPRNTGIYGWDIACKGTSGLIVHASQSDDDFYIEYEGAGLEKKSVWADTTQEFDLRLPTLLFVTDKKLSQGASVSLAVSRQKLFEAGYASGAISIEGRLHPLNCYVRFGAGEDDFDEISRKPFPAIVAP
jgi:hypothetical protein